MKKPTAFGKYFLLERINVGGMAEVFRAKAFGVEGFERLVAVKRILPSIAEDKEFIRMFIEEAKLSVQLNHANIAQIFDLGVVEGSYYIALEHVHGRDLRGIFDRCRQLGEVMPVAQACFIAMKVCEGLDYAHNKRDQAGRELSLVHRDVSPQNVLVSFEGEVKLIDFGIAKAAGTGARTQAGILKGKFGYMSPEQVRGLQVDRRSDVFSCGIVLYELLTGERLFVGESDFSTLEKVRNVEILPPSTYNRRIPDELERIVLKALTKDVDDRYQNAIDLHDELQAFVYTAGEFYSRKDLAGWMKKTFGKEIEEETAKLESYRQLKPPVPTGAGAPPPMPVLAVSAPSASSAPAASSGPPAHSAPFAGSAPPAFSAPAASSGPPAPPAHSAPFAGSAPPAHSAPFAGSVPPAHSAPFAGSAPPAHSAPFAGSAPPAHSAPFAPSATVPAAATASPAPSVPVATVAPVGSSGLAAAAAVSPAVAALPLPARSSAGAPVPIVIPDSAPAMAGTTSASKPVPRKGTQPVAVAKPPPAPSGNRSQPVPVVTQPATSGPASAASSGGSSGASSAAPARPRRPGHLNASDLGWDDDDIETRIYDEDDPKRKARRANLPLQPPVSSSPGISIAAAGSQSISEPELSFAPDAAAWEHGVSPAPPYVPAGFPAGSNNAASPHLPDATRDPRARSDSAPVPRGRELSHAHRVASGPRPISDLSLDPMASFGARITGGRRPRDHRNTLMIGLAGATVAAIAFIAVILLSGDSRPPPVTPLTADPGTGFDLYITPPGMTRWKLDGGSRTDRLPSRIRGIAPGTHTVQIEPPPGFLSQFQQVTVEAGKASKVEIVLQPIPGIVGVFESTPPDATVSLIVDGKRQPVGPSPAKAPLDPRSTYQVLFEKPGYVSVNRPIAFTGGLEEHVSVHLEKADPAAPPANVERPAPKVPRPPDRSADRPLPDRPAQSPPASPPASDAPSDRTDAPAAEPRAAPDARGQGILVLGSKPPCEIAIDGAATGLHTPQKEIKLSAGRHRITLTNSEFGIKETFTVDIKADASEKLIKDYSDKLPN